MRRALRIISCVTLILSVFSAGYMMMNHMGLVEGLDFGAGAYYYADIPEFDRFVNGSAYESPVSFWIIFLLFAVWGVVVCKLWLWIDTKTGGSKR